MTHERHSREMFCIPYLREFRILVFACVIGAIAALCPVSGQAPTETGNSPLRLLDKTGLDESSLRTLPKEVVAVLGSNYGRHAYPAKCIALSPNEVFLASGSRNDSVRVWVAATMTQHKSFAHPDDVDLVWFSSDSRFLHTVCWDGLLRTFDLQSSSDQPITVMQVDHCQFAAAHCNEGGRVWVTNTVIHGDRLPRLVELEWQGDDWKKTGRTRIGFAQLNPGHECITVSKESRWLATRNYLRSTNVASKQRIAIWDLNADDMNPTREVAFEGSEVESLTFDSTSQFLLYADSKRVQVISLNDNSERQLEGPEKYKPRCISFTPDEKQLVVGDYEGRIHFWNWNNGAPEFVGSFAAHADWVSQVAFNKNQSRMYSAGWDHIVHAWNYVEGNWQRVELVGHHHAVSAIAFSNDGGWLATGSTTSVTMEKQSNEVLLWKVEARQPRLAKKMKGCIDQIKSLAFSRDGQYLVAAHDLGLQIWNLNRNDEATSFQREFQEKDRVRKLWGQSAVFLADSHRVIAGWNEGMVTLINIEDTPPMELDACKVPFNYVEKLAATPSGKRVYASSIPIDVVNDQLKLIGTVEPASEANAGPERVGGFDVYRPKLPSFLCVAIQKNGSTVVGADKNNNITIISNEGGNVSEKSIARAHDTRIESILISNRGFIVSGDWNGVVRVRSVDSPDRILRQWQLGRVWSMALAPDQEHVAVGSGTGLTYILRL